MCEMAIKPCVAVEGVGTLGLLGVKVMEGEKIELVLLLRCEAHPIVPDLEIREMMQAKFGLPEAMRDGENKLVVKFNRVIAKNMNELKRKEACKTIAREVKELMVTKKMF